MQPSKANRAIAALLVLFVTFLVGGKLISNDYRFVGVLVILLGVGMTLFALSCSDKTFEKVAWQRWIGL